MIEHHVDIQTKDGDMNTFITHPEENGPFPVVLFFMDAPGKREELHDMARRIATTGYCVILPNLYYRKSRQFVFERTDQGMKKMFEMTHHLSLELVMADTQAMLHYIDGLSQADASRIGAVGYCMSGPFVFKAAAVFNDRILCAASIYGANLVTNRADSPHLSAKNITGEMYFACAEIDPYAPKETIDQLQDQLQPTDIKYRLEWYQGAEHGFAFPDRGEIYHKASAERHWERLHALLDRNLSI